MVNKGRIRQEEKFLGTNVLMVQDLEPNYPLVVDVVIYK